MIAGKKLTNCLNCVYSKTALDMILELVVFVILCLSKHCLTNAQCPLISNCADDTERRDLLAGTSSTALTWRINGDLDMSLLKFYRVPDGGTTYNSAHLIDSSYPGYSMGQNMLTLVNISSLHAGRYYCEYNGNRLRELDTTRESVCVIVTGKAELHCQEPSFSECGAQLTPKCTESVNIKSSGDSPLMLNTEIQFVNGGNCQLQQEIVQVELHRSGTNGLVHMWGCYKTLCQSSGRINLLNGIADSMFVFNLTIENANESDSGEYELRVKARATVGSSSNVCWLVKKFNVTVEYVEPVTTTTPTSTGATTSNSTQQMYTNSTPDAATLNNNTLMISVLLSVCVGLIIPVLFVIITVFGLGVYCYLKHRRSSLTEKSLQRIPSATNNVVLPEHGMSKESAMV